MLKLVGVGACSSVTWGEIGGHGQGNLGFMTWLMKSMEITN